MSEILYKRHLVDEVLKYLDSKEAIVICGARQVGKTSLLKYLLDKHIKENAFYFDLEMRNLLDLCNSGAENVYSYLLQRGADEKRRIYLIIDEIQYLEDPTNLIKILHDHYPNIKLLVSGSSTFEIRKEFRQSLAGRTVNFELYPLSFEEFLTFNGRDYRLLPKNSDAINKELASLAKEFIRFGAYPRIALEKSEEKKQAYLSKVINTYIRKDIRDIGNIKNISPFNKLIEVLASQSSQLLNVSKISNTLGMSRETVVEYLDLLENTFVIKRIRPFHRNIRSELSKNPKVFLLDTGMMHLLWLKEFPKVILGNSFETFVLTELVKSGRRVGFWRTTNKQEVDFVLPGKGLYGIEAKLNFQNANLKSLRFFGEKYGCKTALVGLEGRKTGRYIWELLKELK